MQNNSKRSGNLFPIVITVLVVAAVVGLVFMPRQKRTNREVALACTTDMATEFHIHPNLTIMIDGVKRTIPTDVGIVDGCMNALHTHDDTGKLHVESPEKRDFTLADFFAVWKQPFDRTQILEYKADETHEIRLLVNGNLSEDFENLILRDLDKIMISYQKKAAAPSATE